MNPSRGEADEAGTNPAIGPRRAACRAASVALGVSAGIQAMLTAILQVRRVLDPADLEQLTARGRLFFHPEYDILFYVLGCLGCLILPCVLIYVWNSKLFRVKHTPVGAYLSYAATVQFLLAFAGTVAFLWALDRNSRALDHCSGAWTAALGAPAALTIAAALVALCCGPGNAIEKLLSRLRESSWPLVPPLIDFNARGAIPTQGEQAREPSPIARAIAQAVAILAIISIVAVPSSSRLSGVFLIQDYVPFHHWDYFAIGPALGFLHGGALCTEIYSQYGVGWPMLFAFLAPAIGLNYANVLGVFITCGTAYFVLLFLALRFWLRSTPWAATGTTLAILIQMHHGVHPHMTIWLTPSSTVLRSPMDVAFFLALLLHARRERALWAILAGVFAGLGVLFETDTGIYLLATLGLYLGCRFIGRGICFQPRAALKAVGTPAASLAAALVTAACGLTVASRLTILRPDFWQGWLEPLRLYGGGMSSLPITTSGGTFGAIVFLALAGIYLTILALLIVNVPRGRAPNDLLLGGCLSFYGLEQLLQYVNRSHEFNLYHGSVTFCVLVTALAAAGARRLTADLPAAVGRAISCAALGLVSAALVMNPSFGAYPHLWSSLVRSPAPNGLRLMPGVGGLPAERREFINEFQAVVRRMKQYRRDGLSVAILEPADTMFYLASGCRPPDRYASLLTHIIRKDQLTAARRRLGSKSIDVWIIPDMDSENSSWSDVRADLLASLARGYAREERIGRFGVWWSKHRRPPAQLTRAREPRQL